MRSLIVPLQAVVVICALFGCAVPATTDAHPDDEPLSEFIMGAWKYEGDCTQNGYTYHDCFWVYTFERHNVLRIATENDGGTCRYELSAPGRVSVDCSPRLLDLMTWSIERDEERLWIDMEGWEPLPFQRLAR